MYSRSYGERENEIQIPESYGGTAFIEKTGTAENGVDALPDEKEEKAAKMTDEAKPAGASVQTSLFGRLPFGSLFGGLFENGKFGLQKIGTEEILIIATAAFLFFSGDGDKECAIMLLLLLFIN